MIIVWLPEADADLTVKLAHLAQSSNTAALDQGERIMRKINQLQQFPHLGRIGKIKGSRKLVISGTPFIVVYAIRPQQIEILRLLHAAQKWP